MQKWVTKSIAKFSIKFYKFFNSLLCPSCILGDRTAANTVDLTVFIIFFFMYTEVYLTAIWCSWKSFSWQGAYSIVEFSLNILWQ